MKMRFVVCVVAATMLGISLPALAATYCVSPDGDDDAMGSQQVPWKSIRHGVKSLSPGDTLVVMPGQYCETVRIADFHASKGRRMTIAGRPGAHLLARGQDGILIDKSSWICITGITITGANGKAGLRIVNSDHIQVCSCRFAHNKPWCLKTGMSDYVRVEKCDMNGTNGAICVYFSTTDHPILSGCTLHGAQMGVHVNGDLGEGGDGMVSHARFLGNTIHDIAKTCINLDGVADALIANNLLYDNCGKGIVLFHADGRQTGDHNTVANNTVCFRPRQGRYAFRIIGGGKSNVVVNNIFINGSNTEAALAIASDSLRGLTCHHNIVFNQGRIGSISIDDRAITLAAWQRRGFGIGSMEIAARSVFDEAQENNFHLCAGSAAVDAAIAIDTVVTDINGIQRPAGNGVDIGCHEYKGR